MPIAQLADGTILEFPEGTADDVIDRVVKENLGLTQPEPSLADRNSAMLSDMLQQDVQEHPDPDLATQNSEMLSGMLQQDVIEHPESQPFTPTPEEESFWDKYGKMQAEASDAEVAATEQMGTQLGLGVISPLRMVASTMGADSYATKKLAAAEDYLYGMMDAASRQDMEEAQKIREEAKDKGVLDQVVAAWNAIKADPQSMVRFGAGAVPFMAAALAAPEAGLGISVAAGVGGVKEAIFETVRDRVTQKLVDEGVDENTANQKATEIADKAQAYNGENVDQIVLGGLLGLVTGAKANEITGSVMEGMAEKGLLRSMAESSGALGAFSAQSRLAENVASQREGFDVPRFQGVPGAFAEGAIPGLALGAVHGAQPRVPDLFERYRESTGFRPEDYRAEPTYTPEEPRQLRGPTDESARTDTGFQPPGTDDTGAGAGLPFFGEEGPQEGPPGETQVTPRGGMGISGGDLGTTGGAEGREPSALINEALSIADQFDALGKKEIADGIRTYAANGGYDTPDKLEFIKNLLAMNTQASAGTPVEPKTPTQTGPREYKPYTQLELDALDIAREFDALGGHNKVLADMTRKQVEQGFFDTQEKVDRARKQVDRITAELKGRKEPPQETYNMTTFIAGEEKKWQNYFNVFLPTAPQDVQDVVADSNKYLQDLTDKLNSYGFKISDVTRQSPKHAQDLRSAITGITALTQRYVKEASHVAKKNRYADPEGLENTRRELYYQEFAGADKLLAAEPPKGGEEPTSTSVKDTEPNDITIYDLVDGATDRRLTNKLAVDQVAQILHDTNPPAPDVEAEEAYTVGDTFKGKPDVGKKRIAKMLGPQLYGNPTYMANITLKEVLQNSYDAIKDLQKAGKLGKGRIAIKLNAKTRTIAMTDNGKGMLPQLLATKFLEIAGTGKQDDPNASGGFGIAKMLFLYANEGIHVTTMAKDAEGRSIVSEMKTSGERLFDALENEGDRPDISTRYATDEDLAMFPEGHGTHIELQIPKDFLDPQTNTRKDIHFPADSGLFAYIPDELTRSPLFGDIDVTYNGKDAPIGSKFDAEKYQQFANIKFGWGKVRIYVGEAKDNVYMDNFFVLSNGVYQFSRRIRQKPMGGNNIPYEFYVDVSPTVKPDEPGYPFTFNRKDLTETASKEFDKVFNYIRALYTYTGAAEDVQNYGTLSYVGKKGAISAPIELKPTIPPMKTAFNFIQKGDKVEVKDGVLYVNGKELPELSLEELQADIPVAASLLVDPSLIDPSKVMLHENAEILNYTGHRVNLSDYLRDKFGAERVNKFISVVGHSFIELRDEVAKLLNYHELLKEGVGVSISDYRGVSIRVPFSASFVNPFIAEARNDILETGYGIVGTMLHELAHHQVRNHEKEFPAEMQKIWYKLKAAQVKGGFNFTKFENDFVKAITPFEDIINEANRLYDDNRVEHNKSKFVDASDESSKGYEGDTGETTSFGEDTGTAPARERVQPGAPQGAGPTPGGGTSRGTRTKTTKIDATERKIAISDDVFDKNVGVGDLVLEAKDFKDRLKVLRAWLDAGDVLRIKAILPTMPTDQIVRWIGDKIPQLDEVGTLKMNMDSMRLKRVRRNSEVLDKLSKFSTETPDFNGLKQLAATMHSATLRDVDPTLHRNVQDALLMDEELVDLRAELAKPNQTKASSIKRQITMRENSIKKTYGEWNVLGLMRGGRELFKEVKDVYEEDHKEYVKLLYEIAENSALPGDAKDPTSEKGKLMAAVRMRFVSSKKIPVYFPLSHVGKYWVRIGKGASGQTTMFNTATARNRYVDKYVEGSGKTKTELLRSEAIDFGDDVRSLRSTDKSITSDKLLTEIFELLDKNAQIGGQAPSTKVDVEDIKDAVFQLFFRGLPGGDIRSRYTKRKGKAGFSADIIQSFGLLTNTAAGQLARLKYEGPIKRKLEEAYEHIKSDPKKLTLTPFIDEVAKKMDVELGGNKSLNPLENSIVSFGSKLVFYSFLVKPKQFLVQLTQLPIVGYPTLIRDYGTAKATAISTRYMDLYHKLGVIEDPDLIDPTTGKRISPIRSFKESPTGALKDFYLSNVSLGNSVYVNDRALLKHTFDWADEQLNMFSNTNTADISGRSTTPTKVTEGVISKGTRNMLNFMGAAIHHGERFSREFMFMSAFELAFEDELKKRNIPDYKDYLKANYVPLELRHALSELDKVEDAFDIEKGSANRKVQSPLGQAIEKARLRAVKSTYDALFNYSPYNKPRIMTGMGVLPALGTKLMMYPISMSHVLAVNAFRIIPKYREFGEAEYRRQLKAAKEEGLNDADADTKAKAETKKEKDKIRKQRRDAAVQLFMIEGMQWLFGGLQGAAMVLAILGVYDAAKTFFVDSDEIDPEEQDDITNPLSKKISAYDWFINYGIPEIFGTPEDPFAEKEGWRNVVSRSISEGPISKITGVNIGASTGFNTLFFMDGSKADRSQDSVKLWLFDHTFGAPAAAATGLTTAWSTGWEDGEWGRALEKTPWIFGTAAKAFRHATEGEFTPSGEKKLDKDWFGAGKFVVDMVGFGHTDLAEMQRHTQLYFKYQPEAKAARDKVFDAYNKAAIWEEKNQDKLDNPETAKEANAQLDKLYEAADKLQDKYANSPYGQLAPIKPGAIKLSLDEKRKSRAETKDKQREFLGMPPKEE